MVFQDFLWYNVRRNFVSAQVESQNKSKGTCSKIRRRGLRGAGRFRGIMCAESRIRGDPFDTRELFPCGAGDTFMRTFWDAGREDFPVVWSFDFASI